MKKPNARMTAKEWAAILEKDKDYQSRKRMSHEEAEQRIKEVKNEERPVIEALGRVGIHVEFISDLVNTNAPYPEAWPILVEHLQKDYSSQMREFLARSLAVPGARNTAWEVILSEYKKAAPEEIPNRSGAKDGLAVALSAMATEKDIDTLLELIKEKKNKMTRLFFLRKLLRYEKNEKVINIIRELKNDEDLSDAIQKADANC